MILYKIKFRTSINQSLFSLKHTEDKSEALTFEKIRDFLFDVLNGKIEVQEIDGKFDIKDITGRFN